MIPIKLTEYEPRFLSQNALPVAVGTTLWREFGDKIAVDFPSPKTNAQWRLTTLGWVGHIALTADFHIHLSPKVKLENLFRMWAYAYTLQSAHWLDGLFDANSLTEFYEQLAYLLAQKVMKRGRLGFHRAYLTRTERRPYLRGQLQVNRIWQEPNQAILTSRFAEQTADIPDNQILAYTLGQIARSHRCTEKTQTAVRRATHLLQNITTPTPFQPQDCLGRSYTRLNQDYQPLHALCRFFLEHTGPTHERGRHQMLPFLINMARLFELFVAEWLKAHMPTPWHIKAQERLTVGARDELQFDVDLVLYDGDGRSHTVLDTKYKTPDKPSNDDISQIVTYAKAKGCSEAVLIYPAALGRPLDLMIGDIHLRTLPFSLDGDLDQAGQRLINTLIQSRSKSQGQEDRTMITNQSKGASQAPASKKSS